MLASVKSMARLASATRANRFGHRLTRRARERARLRPESPRIGESMTVVGWVSDPTPSMVGTESQPTQDADEDATLFGWPVHGAVPGELTVGRFGGVADPRRAVNWREQAVRRSILDQGVDIDALQLLQAVEEGEFHHEPDPGNLGACFFD